jgi:hypothetical protein
MLSNADFVDSLVILKRDMSALYEDPFEKNVFIYFDFISWVESKIKGKTFGEIVREKLKHE